MLCQEFVVKNIIKTIFFAHLNVNETYNANGYDILNEHEHISVNKHLTVSQIDNIAKRLRDVFSCDNILV
jgi:hypothetical protein